MSGHHLPGWRIFRIVGEFSGGLYQLARTFEHLLSRINDWLLGLARL